jgi:hypothetical protein
VPNKLENLYEDFMVDRKKKEKKREKEIKLLYSKKKKALLVFFFPLFDRWLIDAV